MVPAIALLVVTLAARLAGWLGWHYTDTWAAATAIGLAAMFVLTGVAHFVQPRRADRDRAPAPARPGTARHDHRHPGAGRSGGPADPGDTGGRRRLLVRADGRHVPGEHLRRGRQAIRALTRHAAGGAHAAGCCYCSAAPRLSPSAACSSQAN